MDRLPKNLESLLKGCRWEEITIGCSESNTFRVKGEREYQYLKIQSVYAKEKLLNEKERLEWLQGKLPVPKVIYYEQDDINEYLLISEIAGKDASVEMDITSVPDLMKQLALGLKMIHSIKIDQCPFDQTVQKKLEEARLRVEKGLVNEDDFDEERKGIPSDVLFQHLKDSVPQVEDLVFAHGDYCLPNIILHNEKINGFIDMGRAGISDRYQDLALAVRSITYNFGKDMIPYFLNEYGMQSYDKAKINFYQLMDEFF
ncbi:aminoglycoside 3'-phosphotransferase [Heyndrickxia oleronia]|uniref:APH(3') family aminoglycoside O-phosphotransferase n=1 Tax=Heyndrickxia oleronia TaxID=38875 RepID=UPI00203EF2CB|nr:APH(3') family aminoglycoside O-phosphotransferase [Heyndrickxia oleronia]MCM3236181.1 aminoglycoside 3'-phosphotransferase [Heyndrickxia oleronia]